MNEDMTIGNITISNLLHKIGDNKLLLPQFQRDFVWDADKQKKLLASFLYGIPTGNILLLKLDSDEDISTKNIGHKDDSKGRTNNESKSGGIQYLMDGQQRLTTFKSIFDDFFAENYNAAFDNLFHNLKMRWILKMQIFKDNGIEETRLRILFDLIRKGDISEQRDLLEIEDSIGCISLKKTGPKSGLHPSTLIKKTSEFKSSLIEKQYLPLFMLLTTTQPENKKYGEYRKITKGVMKDIIYDKWLNPKVSSKEQKEKFEKVAGDYGYDIQLDDNDNAESLAGELSEGLYDSLRHLITEKRKMITVTYDGNFTKAVLAFTAMNTGGLALSTFDIISAKYSALGKKESLQKRIISHFEECCDEEINGLPKIDTGELFDHFKKDNPSKQKPFFNLYLNMLSIYSNPNTKGSHNENTIKDSNKLKLKKEDIDNHTDDAVKSLVFAFRFLAGFCGVHKVQDISYQLMVLPIAHNLYEKYKKNGELKKKDIFALSYWYWGALFGGRYREKQNSRSIDDITHIKKMLNGEMPEEISKLEERLLKDEGYSDFDTLKNNNTVKLKLPIIEFTLVERFLGKELDNNENFIEELEKEKEISHLISKSDCKREYHINPNKKDHISADSPLNLALLDKVKNRADRNKSWYQWSNKNLPSGIIPPKIPCGGAEYNENSFTEAAKKITKEKEGEELYEAFLKARFTLIEEALKNRLKYFKGKITE